VGKEITSKIKKNFLGHFEYEIRNIMYGMVRLRCSNGRFPTIVYVGILTYLRNLYEFFYRDGNGDKAHAKHYISNWENKKPFVALKKWNIQMNTHLSHLSYTRVDGTYKPYPLDELYNHYVELIMDFLNGLEKEYMTPTLKKLLGDLKDTRK